MAYGQSDVQTSTVQVYCNVTKLTLDSNYSVSDTGVSIINLTPTTVGIGGGLEACLYNMSYSYEGVNYVSDSTSRALVSLSTLFFVIAIVLLSYFLVVRMYGRINL